MPSTINIASAGDRSKTKDSNTRCFTPNMWYIANESFTFKISFSINCRLLIQECTNVHNLHASKSSLYLDSVVYAIPNSLNTNPRTLYNICRQLSLWFAPENCDQTTLYCFYCISINEFLSLLDVLDTRLGGAPNFGSASDI